MIIWFTLAILFGLYTACLAIGAQKICLKMERIRCEHMNAVVRDTIEEYVNDKWNMMLKDHANFGITTSDIPPESIVLNFSYYKDGIVALAENVNGEPRISFNPVYCNDLNKKQIRDVVIHELAHLLLMMAGIHDNQNPHDCTWQSIVVGYGISPDDGHDEKVCEPKYLSGRARYGV